MNKVYLLLGSNLFNPEKQLTIARKHLESKVGIIEMYSSIYQTKAWGNTDQRDFLNQAIIINTLFSAEDILKKI